MENGLPQNAIPVLLQSSDGYLWVGTELGLARFDGTAFRLFDHASMPEFPEAEVRCLLEDKKNAGLWIGTSDGLVLWRAGALRVFAARDGMPGGSVRELAQASDGSVWVRSDGGLVRWTGGGFASVAQPGFPAGEITSIAADAVGGVWAGTANGAAVFRDGRWMAVGGQNGENTRRGPRKALVRAVAGGDVLVADGGRVSLARGGKLMNLVAPVDLPKGDVSYLARLADGSVAVAGKADLVLWRQGRVERFDVGRQLPGSRIESMMADRDGCLWVGTNRGLARIAVHGPGETSDVERFPSSDALASNSVESLLEDREGNVWAGTEAGGLHILRDARFRVIGSPEGLSSDATTATVEDSARRVWVGTADSGLDRLTSDADGEIAVAIFTAAQELLSNVVLSLAAGPRGEVWVGTPDGLNRIGPDGARSFTSADGLPDDFIRSLLVAPDGTLWIGTRRGLTHMEDRKFSTLTEAEGLGSDLVGAMVMAPGGDLWIATFHGLSRLHAGRLRNYTTTDGLSSNVITALRADPNGMMWVGTQNAGLNLWDGERFLALKTAAGAGSAGALLPHAIHSIVPDDRGHLWLASDTGLTRADATFLMGCMRAGRCGDAHEHVAQFTTADGLRSRETSSNSHPTSLRAGDGKLWFTTPRGVIVVDPLNFAELPDSPPVAIERFSVDDRDVTADGPVRIGAGAMRFQFDYVGLSFSAPQKVRYRYMLQGFDHGWTDAGARRNAYYTNVPPGDYRFCVQAAMGEDAFAEAGGACELKSNWVTAVAPGRARQASVQFRLVPHYYQMVWFQTLAVLAALGMIFVVIRRRVGRVERELGAVMAERNRIAREIHDTLAQGYVGISLQLELLGQLLRMGKPEAVQKHLEQTQGLVREGLDDARQSIWALRSQDFGEQNLPIRLRRLVERARDGELTATIRVYGAYRPLAPEVEREVLRVAQEAIHNVKKHAQASRMSVRVEYDERSLTVTVGDNGRGIASQAAHGQSGTAGHYGLTGMRERAALIGAELEIAGEAGQGTTVTLRVPAGDAAEATGGKDFTEQSQEQL